MDQMRDSDWSREILLRSDWSGPIVATITTLKRLSAAYNETYLKLLILVQKQFSSVLSLLE